MDDTVLGILLAIVAAIVWGAAYGIARVGLQFVEARSAVILSLVAGLSVALVSALLFEFDSLVSVSLVTIGWAALIGCVHFALARFFLFQSIKYIGAAKGVSIASASPLFTLILAVILLRETLSLLLVMGTVSVVVGLYFVITKVSDDVQLKEGHLLGYTFGFATALSWAVVNILVKHTTQFGSPFVILTFALGFGIIILIATAGKSLRIILNAKKTGIYLLLVSGFLSGIGLASLYSALGKAPVVVVSPLVGTSPLFTIAYVHLFLKRVERVTFQVAIGGLLVVIGGVLIVILNV